MQTLGPVEQLFFSAKSCANIISILQCFLKEKVLQIENSQYYDISKQEIYPSMKAIAKPAYRGFPHALYVQFCVRTPQCHWAGQSSQHVAHGVCPDHGLPPLHEQTLLIHDCSCTMQVKYKFCKYLLLLFTKDTTTWHF